jgi:hypothetical protein
MRRALALPAAAATLATLVAAGCGTTGGTPTAASSPAQTTTSRAPFDGEVLADGEVVEVDKLDGVRLESPDDGRLRNYGVALEVLDSGTADVVDAGGDLAYGAADDATLLAFRLRVTPFAEELGEKVTATVSVDGRQRALPDFEYVVDTEGEDATVQYVVAVPNDRREVELELKYAGLAQHFDLLEGRRTGDAPDILYRSPDAPSVFVENLTPAKLALTDEDGEPGTYVLAVTRAELTYFTAELGDVPGADDKAWLVVTYEPSGEGSLDRTSEATGCVVPFAAFTLGDPAGGVYPVVDKHSTMELFDTAKSLVFEVPADLTAATLTLSTPGFSCRSGGIESPFTATGAAAVEMTLPED